MRRETGVRAPAMALAAVLLVPAAAQAQGAAFDRSKAPEVAPPAGLTLPAVQQAALPNGIALRVVPMHEVPLVQVTIRVHGGARLDGDLPGLATFTAAMLDEGAGRRDGLGISAEAAYLGAQLFTSADWDYLDLTLNVPRRSLGPALDLLADVTLRPTFRAADVARERDLRLANILQQRDQPNGMAALAFGAIVFPAAHPYHRPIGGDSAATAGLDSTTVRAFYDRVMRPDQATFIVTGDISLAEAKAEIARRFGGWKQNRMLPLKAAVPPPVARPATRRIFLVDKPGAAQSVIMIGAPGLNRSSPDYAAVQVMNTILGGSFSSRLNQNLRETKGYTYGAGSGFAWRPVPGPFQARAAVRTDVTDSSLVEFFKELNAIRDAPVSDAELARARNYIAFGLPGEFETAGQMNDQLAELLTFGLPITEFDRYVRAVLKVTAADVQRVARSSFDPAHLDVLVVGDAARIRPGLEALDLGPVVATGLDGSTH